MRERRETRAIAAAVFGAVACAGIAWGVVSLEAGCQLQGQCDPSTVTVGQGTGPGTQPFQADAGVYLFEPVPVWQSSGIDGTWMNFPPERSYIIYPQLPDGGPLLGPYQLFANLSPDPDNYTTIGSNYANGSGNLAEFSQSASADGGPPDHFQVTNETCAPYYLWVQATAPLPAAASDAGETADASDAGDSEGASDGAASPDGGDAAPNDADATDSGTGTD